MKEEIYEKAYKLIMEDTRDLNRGEYRDLLYEVIDACKEMLAAMDSDD